MVSLSNHDRNMKSTELRKQFLDFFTSKGHAVVPSDSLIPANDPSLLFTGAGMNQFKDYFLGIRREMKRAASCQKCFRTGDVEQVGQTASHLTFFEMLGNFSFGDYFKKEACLWAWEFMTVRLKIPKEKLWATVYEQDEEAAELWKKQVGLPPERIVRMGAKDNFWPSNAPTEGPNGPCGPCSELHYDYGCCTIGKKCPDLEKCRPGCPCGRFVEVWNLVFTQYDRQPDGSLKPLPAPNIDTGMGLERLAAVMQDKMSVFETDLFAPIAEAIERVLQKEVSEPMRMNQKTSIYAIADHVRALVFIIGDGVVPSNDGRGYVLRMLLRKALRAGLELGMRQPFLGRCLVSVVTNLMREPYPELTSREKSIGQMIYAEEERFFQMLEEKLPLLKGRIKELKQEKAQNALFSAQEAANFYDTHGLSLEEISEVCQELQVTPPSKEEFEKALTVLQAQSKKSSAFGAIFSKDALAELLAGNPPTEFIGYGQELTAQAKVLCLIREGRSQQEVKEPGPVEVILDRSPFYGEAGGQVGDAGVLLAPGGELKVADTQWVGAVLAHQAELVEGSIRVNDPVQAKVDASRRGLVARNHTATHLLHSALRRVLGPHVMQAGSLVAPDHLRLDFSHGQGLSRNQRDSVESLVNEWVEQNYPVRVDKMEIAEAKKSGAMALFGEKYGSQVRVVSIGDVSKELCGGTHLKETGDVGLLMIVEEGSIASGVRRIEALSAQTALDSLRAEVVRLQRDRERLMKQNKQLEEEKNSLKIKGAA